MKTKFILLTSLIASGLALGPSAFAANGRAAPRSGRSPIVRTPNPGNPTAAPKQDGTGRYQRNPARTPKRDGTGGPNRPANPTCPQDGSGARPRG